MEVISKSCSFPTCFFQVSAGDNPFSNCKTSTVPVSGHLDCAGKPCALDPGRGEGMHDAELHDVVPERSAPMLRSKGSDQTADCHEHAA